ncbi:MAG TPA: glutamate-cysteine ligase family protein [Pirellulales bacterium]|jgi:gamma-glutamyl:cysteine ligase YbdK (ATP-grasp superfamily)
MSTALRLRLFQAYGVELEYMIVDAASLDVCPIADELLRDAAGGDEYVGEIEAGDISWSNELVAHVVELKTTDPATSLVPLAGTFQAQVRRINELLARHGARLLPGGMHPWMDPLRETKLWPHDCNEIYEGFNKIFDCRGHGWSNLQSVHLNLPFADDEEFGRLHAAIRVVLPILPAIAASSPIVDGVATGTLDTRLDVYRGNSKRIPSVTGHVVPEAVFSEVHYRETILGRLYADIAPHDPAGVLQHEWLNARGAIARFERNTIEIRVLDIQECPAADLAVCGLAVGALRALVDERFVGLAEQQQWPAERLAEVLQAAIRDGERAIMRDAEFLRLFGVKGASSSLADLWQHIHESVPDRAGRTAETDHALGVILREGPLARRILQAVGRSTGAIDRSNLHEVYSRLCACLARGEMFSTSTGS